MNDDIREKRWQDHFPRSLPRYVLLVCLALVVVSLGVVLMPARPPVPAQPPFTEQARAAALAETVRLLDAGSHLGAAKQDRSSGGPAGSADGPSASAGNPAIRRTVTLLTTQAQALLAPGENPANALSPAAGAGSGSGRPTPPATSSATPAPSVSGTSGAGPSAAPLPSTPAGLVTALAKSGRQRLADAAAADGGMARLLAAVGTAQLLQASALAAGAGTAAPAADVAPPQPSGTCPSPSAASPSGPAQSDPGQSDAGQTDAGQSDAGQSAAASSLGGALAAVVRTEAQAVYGYQVALPRLGGDAAKSAAEQLSRHVALLGAAESLTRLNCSAVPPREAGYRLDGSFLASPAAGLGTLEAGALPAYGDLVALSEGATRQWAIAALLGAGKRAALWGTDPGALPGLDPATQPTQPSQTAG